MNGNLVDRKPIIECKNVPKYQIYVLISVNTYGMCNQITSTWRDDTSRQQLGQYYTPFIDHTHHK